KTQLQSGQGKVITEPRVLSMNNDAFNDDVPATGSLQNMLMWEAGVFTGTPADGLSKTTLIHSSVNSQLVMPSQQFDTDGAERIMSKFSAEGKTYDLAIMVSGKFKTAFPDGPPAKAEGGEDEEGEEKEEEPKADKDPLKESASDNTVALIGDVDMLHDQAFLRPMRNPFTGQATQTMINTNMVLVQNMLEQMAGNENLIKIRSRTAAQRSFTKLREMDEESDKKFRDAAEQGQNDVDAAQRKLSEIVQSKGENISVHNLDPETQKALDDTRETLASAKKKLRGIKLDSRKDKEALLGTLKGANILIVPIMVIVLGILLAFIRKSKTAAK
ncbi:MAG: Gldg family protein, partial [Verrucomicrobiales bacterium]